MCLRPMQLLLILSSHFIVSLISYYLVSLWHGKLIQSIFCCFMFNKKLWFIIFQEEAVYTSGELEWKNPCVCLRLILNSSCLTKSWQSTKSAPNQCFSVERDHTFTDDEQRYSAGNLAISQYWWKDKKNIYLNVLNRDRPPITKSLQELLYFFYCFNQD